MKTGRKFKRTPDELKAIFHYLENQYSELGLSGKCKSEIDLSVEEIFMNMVRHNSGSRHDIEISLVRPGPGRVVIHLRDHENVPFDLTKLEELDVDAHAEKLQPGGLGIHLVRRMMDEVKFEHRNGISRITLVKHITEEKEC